MGAEMSQSFSKEAKLCGFILVKGKGKITFHVTFHRTG